jgi:uncharacterized protein YjiS (DUF1127 family)
MPLADVSSLSEWAPALAPLAGWPEIEARKRPIGRGGVWARFCRWRAQRKALEALYALDRRTLKDIGISVQEIESVVYSDGGDRVRRYDCDWRRK